MPQASALSIGNFDGVHRGHQALIRRARERVGSRGTVVALVFDPHPLAVLRPEARPPRLTRFDQRRRLLHDIGVDEVIQLKPTGELLSKQPERFLSEIVERFRPDFMVEGHDFRFGRNRTGNLGTLEEMGPEMGFEAVGLDPVEVTLTDHSVVRASSSVVRWMITHGRIRDANVLLGRASEVEGRVTPGDRRGREIGFPTVNLGEVETMLPADGVYAGIGELPNGERRLAAISVGSNPTFDGQARRCEAHLIDFEGPRDEYGWRIRLFFHAWLRDQIAYDSIDPLVRQLHRDVERTRTLLTEEWAHA